MQVFKLFMKILKKKLLLSAACVASFLALCIITTVTNSSEKTFTDTKIDICIFDEDNTPESQALVDYIASRLNIKKIENDRQAITDALFYSRIDYALTINKGYAQKLADGETEGMFTDRHLSESYGTAYMNNFLEEYVSCINTCIAGGESLASAIDTTDKVLSEGTEVVMISKPQGSGFSDGNGYFRYLAYFMPAVMISSLSPVLMTLNKSEVRFRTNCSTIRPVSAAFQIFAGSTVFVASVWLLFITAGIFLKGEFYSGNDWWCVLNSLLFSVISALIALLVAMLMPKSDMLMLVANVICLGMSFLCGVFVPMELLSDSVKRAGQFLPAYWYTMVNEMINGTAVFDKIKLVSYIGIEAAFVAAFAAVALLLFKLKFSSVRQS